MKLTGGYGLPNCHDSVKLVCLMLGKVRLTTAAESDGIVAGPRSDRTKFHRAELLNVLIKVNNPKPSVGPSVHQKEQS